MGLAAIAHAGHDARHHKQEAAVKPETKRHAAPHPHGHRVRTLAEQVCLAQQVAHARLTLRLIMDCTTPVVLP